LALSHHKVFHFVTWVSSPYFSAYPHAGKREDGFCAAADLLGPNGAAVLVNIETRHCLRQRVSFFFPLNPNFFEKRR
jgi:hypothetical protein